MSEIFTLTPGSAALETGVSVNSVAPARAIQVRAISSSATVEIQGAFTGSNWEVVRTVTASSTDSQETIINFPWPKMRAVVTSGTANVIAAFLDTPMTPVNAAGAQSVMSLAGVLTDKSGSIATAATAQTAVAANTSRKYLIIQNTGTYDLTVSLTGTAGAVGSAGSITLVAGDALRFTDGFIPTNAVSVRSAVAGVTFTIWEA